MIQDVFNLDQSTGGSTITQQLVKTKCYQVKKHIVEKQMSLF